MKSMSSYAKKKAWSAIDRLMAEWKSDLSDKIKVKSNQTVAMSVILYDCNMWTLTKRLYEKLDSNYARVLPAVQNKS